jgi:hypothetical protein
MSAYELVNKSTYWQKLSVHAFISITLHKTSSKQPLLIIRIDRSQLRARVM